MKETSLKRSPSSILVVEDDKEISGMLKAILSEEGYAVTACLDGKEAMHLMETVAPDLVLLDLQLPNRSGADLLKDIRKKDVEFGIFIPVIVLTGVYTTRHDKVTSLDAGADDFLPKPFDMVELLARVRSLLRVRDLYKRSQYLATHDHLTRCYNRRYLLDFLAREQERYKRHKAPFTYLLIDLDHFKQINDQFGHETGDSVLVHVGFHLQDFFRAIDCVARLGGDEFSVVLPETDAFNAQKVGERLMKAMTLFRTKESLPKEVIGLVGFSVGGASVPTHSLEIEDLMNKADEAMYQSKKGGRNCFSMARS